MCTFLSHLWRSVNNLIFESFLFENTITCKKENRNKKTFFSYFQPFVCLLMLIKCDTAGSTKRIFCFLNIVVLVDHAVHIQTYLT